MANIFISYNREDKDKTKALVDDMEKLGHNVWFDEELSGGQKWWAQILESIRNCDLFVFVLSVNGLDSSACSLEYEYADALGKTILPVLVGEGVSPNLLPPVLSQIQFVDYRKPDRDAILNLAKAFAALPSSKPLPNPLPTPPEVPISYLGSLGKQVESRSKLSYEEQSALLFDLKRGLLDNETKSDARTLLQKLRKRHYLFENIAEEIDELLEDTVKDTKASTHDINMQHTISKKSLNQKTENSEGYKKSFWTSVQGIVAGLVIAVGLYFTYTYFIVPSQYSYVCYDKKIEDTQGELFYKGCAIYTIDCSSAKKEHFGRYLNKADAKVAYKRCLKGKPLIVPSLKRSRKDVSQLLEDAKKYYYGRATTAKDYHKAKEYFLKAAELNSVDAYRYLGIMYLFGYSVTINKEEAKKWLQMAIDLGDVRSKELYKEYIENSTYFLSSSSIKEMSLDEQGIKISIAYPSEVRAGESFMIKATMLNQNAIARMGGLTLSFPDMISINGEGIENSFDTLNNYTPPAKLYNLITRSNMASKYVVIEGWQNGWALNKSKSFAIRFMAPSHIRNLRVNVRAVLVVGTTDNKREVSIPASSHITDQQGYYAKQFSIKIKE